MKLSLPCSARRGWKSTTPGCFRPSRKSPTSGRVTINGYTLGKDDDAIWKSIGVVFQYSPLDGDLRVRENLRFRGRFHYRGALALWTLIMKIRNRSERTILLSTHYMQEVVDCDHVFILNEGTIVAEISQRRSALPMPMTRSRLSRRMPGSKRDLKRMGWSTPWSKHPPYPD